MENQFDSYQPLNIWRKTEKHFGMCGIGSTLSFSTCNVLILNPCEQKLQLKQHREGMVPDVCTDQA